MSDSREDMVVMWMRRLDGKLDKMGDDMADLKQRMTSLDAKVALLHGDFAAQSLRIDRLESRLGRIEARLGLVDA